MNKKYVYGTEENRKFLTDERNELFAFGRQFPSESGSSYYLGDHGEPWKERSRETWITCRMAHVYSMAGLLGYEDCGELVDAAIKGLLGELKDKINGGWYPGITSDSRHEEGKQCYAHAFVILAASSALAYGRPQAQELLKQALEVYDCYFWDEEEGMARDNWNTAFTVCDPYRGINANMHSVEAFLAAADVTGQKEYRERAGRIITRVITFAEANNWRIPEHFTKDWKPDLQYNKDHKDDRFKPFGATPGHGVEWARLIVQWAWSVWPKEKDNRVSYLSAAENLYNRAISDGWNTDGAPGIVYTTDWKGQPIVHDRMHWTLAEAINTSATLLQATGKEKYAKDYYAFMQYLDEKVIDHSCGSWFHQLDRENRVIGTVWPGKSDLYHATQAMLIPYYGIGMSIVPAIKDGIVCRMDY